MQRLIDPCEVPKGKFFDVSQFDVYLILYKKRFSFLN